MYQRWRWSRRLGPIATATVLSLFPIIGRPTIAGAVDTPDFGDMVGRRLTSPVVGFAARPQGDGYWLVTARGNVYDFGAARWRGALADRELASTVRGIAATPDGRGYYLFLRNGRVFAFGTAAFHGSASLASLDGAAVSAMAVTTTGAGYWLVTERGRVLSFGDADPHGNARPPAGVAAIGLARTPDDDGYWVALSNGRVAARGSATHHGDSRGRVSAAAVGIVATGDGGGYWIPQLDGRVLDFGNAPYRGALRGSRFAGFVVGMDSRADDRGFWLASTAGRVFPFPGTDLPPAGTPQLNVTTVAGGLTIPWDVGFLPNRTLLFTQRVGQINAYVGGSVRTLAAPADVVVASEAGVMGLAVDPDFDANRRVYVCMTSNLPVGSDDVRVVRFRVNEAVTALTNRADIVTGLPVNTFGELGRHSGCRPRFGPDGFLWVGTGDAAVGTVPQNDNSLGGKVLRVDTSGNAAPGNPGGRRWYSKGHRNIQGLAFQPGTNRVYVVEHGSYRDDEINRIVNGSNYGWDPVPGYNESVPMTDFGKFPGAKGAAWSSGNPTIATSGADFLVGDAWRDWEGMLAVATLKESDLRIFRISANGEIATQVAVRLDNAHGRLRTVVMGPNGSLYITTSNGGGTDQILKVTPS